MAPGAEEKRKERKEASEREGERGREEMTKLLLE